MSEPYRRIVVVGATSWGTTLAILLSNLEREVSLLVRMPGEAADLTLRRENHRLLPGVALPLSLTI
ncbi:MAG TPA: glycerol-3-phosphate dehydrogenase, partial [Dehalococcoidia bacterium]|nr:glycerol-3-phosphate dehydrogenase [Dehalococcoidia bacterium]